MTPAGRLSVPQQAFYADNGYLVLENQVPMDVIENIREEITRFEQEAEGLTASNDRLDLEDTHQPDAPRIRRIKLPHTTSDVVRELLFADYVLGPARDLLGPDIRLHTTKLNMKSANYGAPIGWHQDFAFYPHTNDDVLAIGVVIDDMAEENGPLMVVPGSHKGPIFDHHKGGIFAGAMDMDASGVAPDQAVSLTASAGALTFHHARIIHGSALNTSARDRRLLFMEMMAADAFPIMGSMTRFTDLAEYDSKMLCGSPTITPRIEPVPVRIPLPQPEQNRSIYEIQSSPTAATPSPLRR